MKDYLASGTRDKVDTIDLVLKPKCARAFPDSALRKPYIYDRVKKKRSLNVSGICAYCCDCICTQHIDTRDPALQIVKGNFGRNYSLGTVTPGLPPPSAPRSQ